MDYGTNELIILPITLLVIIIISFLTAKLLKNKSEKIRRIVIAIIPTIMIALEIVKQILEIVEGYGVGTLPLHFCSLYMIWFALAEYGKGRVRQFGKALSMATSILFLVMFYINPTSIIGGACNNVFATFGSFHTFIYHHFIMLYLFLNLFMNTYKPQKADLLYDAIGLSSYFIVGTTLANLLNYNYCNLLHSNIGFMQAFLENTNYALYLFVMFVFGISAVCLITLIYMLIYNAVIKRKKKCRENKN